MWVLWAGNLLQVVVIQFRKHNMGFQSYDDLDVQSLPSLARDALKTPASSTCLSVVCLPLLVLLLALSSSGGIKIGRGEIYKCSSGHWKRDSKGWLVVAPENGEENLQGLVEVVLRVGWWSCGGGGARHSEGPTVIFEEYCKLNWWSSLGHKESTFFY